MTIIRLYVHNMDLVNIIYRYVNRFINSEELIESLTNLDKKKFSKKEMAEIEKLLNTIKQIIESVPVEIDQIEIKRLVAINHMLESLEKVKPNNKGEIKKLKNRYTNLLKDKHKTRDSGPRYIKLYDSLVNNSVYINYCEKMTDLELLEFITQYISVPIPPNINQELFNDLVKIGTSKDKRESLWRLASNYNRKGMDFTDIEDYFIEKRDDYYLIELISAVQDDIDMDKLIKKIIDTKDNEFIIKCGIKAKDIGFINAEELKKLKEIFKGIISN